MPNCLATLSDPTYAVVRQVVQNLGTALGRAAGVVDCEFNQLAYSDDFPTLRGTAQFASQLRRVGGFGSLRPVWLPADPTLAAPATVWLPIRYEGRLLGFLWLVHPGARAGDVSRLCGERAPRRSATVSASSFAVLPATPRRAASRGGAARRNQRLCLHMAFKLGRFAGRYPLSAAGGTSTLSRTSAGPRRRHKSSTCDNCPIGGGGAASRRFNPTADMRESG